MKYVQCELKHGSTRRICWLRADKIGIGKIVTLKNDGNDTRQWRVTWVGDDFREQEELHTDWNNNI